MQKSKLAQNSILPLKTQIDSPKPQYLSLDNISDFDLESLKNSLKNDSKPIIFGICGGQNSGKSFTSIWLKQNFEKLKIKCTILKEKYFLKNLDKKNLSQIDDILWNDFENVLQNLIEGNDQKIVLHYLKDKPIITIKSPELLIVEGRLIFSRKNIRQKLDLRMFLDTDSDIILSRKIYRDIQKGKKLQKIIEEYLTRDKILNENIIPQKEEANLVIFNFQQEQISTQKFEPQNPMLQMILDVLKFRLKDFDYEARLVNDKMSFLNKIFKQF